MNGRVGGADLEPIEHWHGHPRCDEGHHQEHGEQRGRKDMRVVGDVEHDHFHKAARVQQRAQSDRRSLTLSGPAHGEDGSSHFAGDSQEQNKQSPEPDSAIVEQVETGSHAGKGKEERKQQQ